MRRISYKRWTWALALCTLLSPWAAAQGLSEQAAAVAAMPPDTAKVLKLSDLCYAYRRANPDSARLFGEAALQLARKLNYAKGKAQAYNDLAILRIDHSNYHAADSLLQLSLALRVQLADSSGMAAVHNKLGIIHQARYMFEQALEEDFKALAIYERIGPPAHEATLLNNIAILQFNLGRLQEAMATHEKAAKIREQIGDVAGLAASLGNLANVEARLGDTARAVAHYRSAIDFFRSREMPGELSTQLNNLAGIQMAQGQLYHAAANYGEALALRMSLGDRKGVASSLIGMGGTRIRQGHLAEAGELLHRGLQIGHEVDGRSEQMQALIELARLHAKLGNSDSTFLYHQQYAALKDSTFNTDMGMRLAQAQTRFETERKEREILAQRAAIAELERESEHRKLWLVSALGGLALVTMGGALLLQVQRRRSKARHDAALLAEREAGLRGVLKATDNERARISRELHDGIGQQVAGLRFRLEQMAAKAATGEPPPEQAMSEALGISTDVGREVREIAHALMPRTLGQAGLAAATQEMLERSCSAAGIKHTFDHYALPGQLPSEMETGLYRIAQELVQNTLKHAGASQVNLQLMKNKDHLVLLYEDDGRGLGAGPANGGIGLRNIHERVHALRGKFSIGNGPKGILATVRVPLAIADI